MSSGFSDRCSAEHEAKRTVGVSNSYAICSVLSAYRRTDAAAIFPDRVVVDEEVMPALAAAQLMSWMTGALVVTSFDRT